MLFAKSRSLEIPLFIAYIFLLLVSNIINDFAVTPYVTHSLPNFYLQTFIGLMWTIMFWIVPTFLYIICVNKTNPFTYLKLTTNISKGLLWTLAGVLWFVLVTGSRHFLQGIPINLHLSFSTWLNMIVLVGFVEEIPLRGLVFQKLNEFMGFWPASLLGSFVFVCLHFPYWISIGKSPLYFLSAGLSIFALAWILCFILKRSGSLWPCIIIHSMNDMVSLIL